MAKRVTGPEIEKLIQLLAKVPGLGPRSARRAALHLIKKKDQLMGPLAHAMGDAFDKVKVCSHCGNVDTVDPCTVCTDDRRDQTVIIVVEDVSDLWALERAGAMNAAYHVLGGTLSPLDGIGPDDLNIKGLIDRVAKGGIREIIIAVNATVEGQTTAHYITDHLAGLDVRITRLAHGVPVGGE
ncbi:MAG: recombination mediator RecR, partial [Rhizobium sp.]|nr:recombination mediator RecR [Rhizobium sp.]